INKLWGTSSSDLYAVGNSGNIAHYDGVSWKKIESGTDMDFYHISGFKHPKTQKMEILLVCCDFMANRRGLYSMENKTLKWLSTSPASWDLLSVWFIPDRHYYLVGSGIYDKIRLSEKQWRGEILGITRYNTNEIFGNALNDIFVVGDFGEVLYFNGIRWKSYMEKLGKLSGAYGGVRMHKNIVVIVGFNDRKATILFGKR
ncbi:MAG: glucosyl transferase, partial [Ignavibacteriaceae bacterium]|nr:glucosyl transferase [Ignavibacteriaceae bacterium]